MTIIRPALLFFTLLFSVYTTAQQATTKPLVIGTKVAAPFVIKTADGEFEGISIDLWKKMAQELNLDYRFEEAELSELISGLQDGSYDASIAAITVTSQREVLIDFTHPFFTTGLAIATTKTEQGWMSAIKRFFSWEF